MSRQSEWQRRQRAAGNCIICGDPRTTTTRGQLRTHANYCEKHRLAQCRRQQGYMTSKPKETA